MNLDQVVFHLGEEPVTALRLGVALFVALGFAGLALATTTYFRRRLLWPGSAGGTTVQLLLAVFRAGVIVVGLVTALATLGVNVLPLVGIILAVAAIAALSWRTTSEQIWAGLLILWERPFALGERIQVGDYEGEVERLGLRTTTLRSEERVAVHVPNSYLTTHAIHNRSKTEGGFGLRIPVEVMPHCDSGEVISALRKAAERNNRVRSSPSPKAFMTGFTPRGLQFELRAWVDAYTDGMWATNEICRAIQSEFQRAGLQLVSAARTGSRPAPMESSLRTRPRPEAERERGSYRDRDKDRDRDRDRDRDKDRDREPQSVGESEPPRETRPERPRSDRSSRPERRSGRDSGAERHQRGRRPAEPMLQSPGAEPAPIEIRVLPLEDVAAEVVSELPEPDIFETPPARVEPEPPAAPVYVSAEPEPEPVSAPDPAPADEPVSVDASPTFGRSKRKVPRR